MADLRLDLDVMRTAGLRLTYLKEQFDAAEAFNAGLGDAAGHRGLGSAIGDFASAWNIRRSHLSERIGTVRDALDAVRETFRDLDTTLAGLVPEPLEIEEG